MALKITECLLDNKNETVIGDTTVGAKIAMLGREHYWAAREFKRIDTVVIHYISAVNVDPLRPFDLELILDIFCTYGVSSHYLIDRGGKIYRLVPEEMKAWHCGPSRMPLPDDRLGVNDFSIGIELMGGERRQFNAPQYIALARLCRDIEIRRRREMKYVGHEDVAGARAVELGLRKEPKTDPGPRFDWARFKSMLEDARTRWVR